MHNNILMPTKQVNVMEVQLDIQKSVRQPVYKIWEVTAALDAFNDLIFANFFGGGTA